MRASAGRRFVEYVAICLFILLAQAPGRLVAGGIFGTSAENLSLTAFDDNQPIVKVRAARIFVDHEKFGFFRVGLAPLAVIQGVRVEIESAGRLTNALDALNSWNDSSGSRRHLEFRDLEISLLGESESRLHAATARVNASGALELFQVVAAGGPPLPIARATLEVTGPTAGSLRWRDGQQDRELFVLKPSEKSKL